MAYNWKKEFQAVRTKIGELGREYKKANQTEQGEFLQYADTATRDLYLNFGGVGDEGLLISQVKRLTSGMGELATKDDLNNLATGNEVAKLTDKLDKEEGELAKLTDEVDKLATKDELTNKIKNLAKSADLKDLGQVAALATEVGKFTTEFDKLATKDDLNNLATGDEVGKLTAGFDKLATKDDLNNLATGDEVGKFTAEFDKLATKDDLNNLATGDEVGKFTAEFDKLATKDDLNNLATGDEIAKLTDKLDKEEGELAKLTDEVDKLATKDDLNNLATGNEVAKLTDKLDKEEGELAKLTDEVDKLATKDDLNNLATGDEIAKLTDKLDKEEGELAKLTDEVDKLATKDELTNKIKNLAKSADLKDLGQVAALATEVGKFTTEFDKLATKDDLNNLATGDEVGKLTAGFDKLATKDDLNNLATGDEVGKFTAEFDKLATKDDLNNLATGDEVGKFTAEFDKLATKDDLNNLATGDEIAKLTDKLDKEEGELAKLTDEVDKLATKDEEAGKINTLAKGVAAPKEFDIKIIKGNEIADGKYEADIVLEDSIVGTFLPTGYYLYENVIYIYDHIAKKEEGKEESVGLPESYHFIKVVNDDGDYKLAFCNQYGQEYYKISNDDNYKFIDVTQIKSGKNIDLVKYSGKNGSNPSFVIKADDHEYHNSQKHGIDVYEIGSAKKIGSLEDEFGYYDAQNKFYYVNHKIGAQNHSYDPLAFIITKGNNSCQLNTIKECDNITNKCSPINENHANIIDCSLTEYVANYVNDIM